MRAILAALMVCLCADVAPTRAQVASSDGAKSGERTASGERFDPLSVRDDGQFANSPLKQWFNKLASGKGLCCSFADGVSIKDVDWETRDGKYRVRLDGQWIEIPDAALVTEPNKFGPAVAWPYQDESGATQIRCFLPGAGA